MANGFDEARRRGRRAGPVLVVLLPLAAYGLFVLPATWRPATFGGDQALLELWTRSALHGEALVGPYSRFGWNHPGPATFYWFAPFYWVSGQHPGGLGLAALVLNGLGLGTVVAVVGRAVGRPAAWAAAVVVLAFLAVTGPTWWDDTWNPILVVVPVVVAGVSAAGVAAGRRWLVPVAVAAVSFTVQTHLGSGAPVAVFGAIVALAVAIQVVQDRRGWVRPLGAAAAVATAFWALPAWDQLTHEPGNLGLLKQYNEGPVGDYSRQAVLDRIGVQLTLSKPSLMDTMIGPSSHIPTATDGRRLLLVALVLAVVACAVVNAWQRRWFELVLGAGSLAGVAGLMQTLDRVNGLLEGYLTLSATGLGLLLQLSVVLTVLRLVVDRWPQVAAWRPPLLPGAAVALALVLAVVVVATDPRADVYGDRRSDTGGAAAVAAIEGAVADGAPVRLEIADGTWPVASLLANQLERDGHRVSVPTSWRFMFGWQRLADGCERATVSTRPDGDGGPAGARRVGRAGAVSVWVATRAPTPACGG